MEITTQDPNQLTFGIETQVLTAVEEARLAEFKAANIRSNERLLSALLAKRAFLLENGFEEGKDFSFSLTEKEVDYTVNVATHWKADRKEVICTATSVQGGCTLLYKHFDKFKGEIVTRTAGFDIERGKMECYGIVGTSRKVTPKTLKTKMEELNFLAGNDDAYFNNTKSIVSYTIEKYRNLIPDAQVTEDRDYVKYGSRYHEFETVKVSYSNGSLLVMKLGTLKDQESVHKFVDAATKNLTAVELAQYLGQ